MTIRAIYTYAIPHTEENSFTDSVTAVAIAQDAERKRGQVAADLGWPVDEIQLIKIQFIHEPGPNIGLAPNATTADVVGA